MVEKNQPGTIVKKFLNESFDFIGFVTCFCLTFFTVEFGYDKANQPNTLACASTDIISPKEKNCS